MSGYHPRGIARFDLPSNTQKYSSKGACSRKTMKLLQSEGREPPWPRD
jgi:hypothetical protein